MHETTSLKEQDGRNPDKPILYTLQILFHQESTEKNESSPQLRSEKRQRKRNTYTDRPAIATTHDGS